MPSPSNLEKFAARFRHVGHEAEILEERGEKASLQDAPPEVTEIAPPAPPPPEPDADFDTGFTPDFAGLAADLLDNSDGALPPLPEDNFPDMDEAAESIEEDTPPPDLSDLDLGDIDIPASITDDLGEDSVPNLDLDLDAPLPDIDPFIGAEPPPIDDAPSLDDALSPLDDDALPLDMDVGGLDLGGVDIPEDITPPDLDLGDIDITDAVAPPPLDAAIEDDIAPSLEGIEDVAPLEGIEDDFSAMEEVDIPVDLGDGLDAIEPIDAAEEVAPLEDNFENFEVAESETAMPDLDDFHIPGMEVGGEKPQKSAASAPSTQRGAPQRTVADLKLTEEEYDNLVETLATYPLNLRLACEEAIAEAAIPTANLAQLTRHIANGGNAREAAKIAGKILDRTITVPRGFQKQTGEELAAIQASFGYIFVKKFLPVFGFFMFIAACLASAVYLGYQFIYKPLHADSLYKAGLERIAEEAYERGNEYFNEAWRWHKEKDRFYDYARAFREKKQYILAREKYDQLIAYTAYKNKKGVPEKKGVLEYAEFEAGLRDYEKADALLKKHILDWNPDDPDALLARGDVNLLYGDEKAEFADDNSAEPDGGRWEIARENYARYIQLYGRTDAGLERMLRYFIRADDLGEVLPLEDYFMSQKKLKCAPSTLTEIGGYYLDKQLEVTRLVRDENIERINSAREVLVRAANAAPLDPLPQYHLARYYKMISETARERQYLDNASALFDGEYNSKQDESPVGARARIDTEQRLAHMLRDRREFVTAEERLSKAADLYEDGVGRRVFRSKPSFGSIYAELGDISYFTKFSEEGERGNYPEAIRRYNRAAEIGYSNTVTLYRTGSAYYHLADLRRAEEYFFDAASQGDPPNRRLLNALGNVSFRRGNLSAAGAYYSRLIGILQSDRLRIGSPRINESQAERDLMERLMFAQNNLGATYDAEAGRQPASRARPLKTRSLALYTEASSIWENLSRNPTTFVRPGLADYSTPSVSLPYLNMRNALYPTVGAESEIFNRIDRDIEEPSMWEDLLYLDGRF